MNNFSKMEDDESKKRILDDKNDKKKEKVKLSQFEEKLLHDDLLFLMARVPQLY